jgi:hypothetical protein
LVDNSSRISDESQEDDEENAVRMLSSANGLYNLIWLNQSSDAIANNLCKQIRKYSNIDYNLIWLKSIVECASESVGLWTNLKLHLKMQICLLEYFLVHLMILIQTILCGKEKRSRGRKRKS